MKNANAPMSKDELCRRMNAGESFKFLHFWGHQPSRDGSISNSCFSQWYGSPFVVDGTQYATAEHFMMAAKARLFNDHDALNQVMAAASPAAAKAVGRRVKGFDDDLWVAHRFEIVCAASLAKFSQNAALRDFLVGTNRRVIVEASPVDRIWGIGLSATDSAAENPSLWKGLNLLGFALMRAREQIATTT